MVLSVTLYPYIYYFCGANSKYSYVKEGYLHHLVS